MSDQIDLPQAAPAPETPRRRRLPRLLGTVALVVGVAVVSSLTTVWANHSFPDVPNSSPHHSAISWAVANDITQGYGDGTYKPSQAVSRAQMATFLYRYNGELATVSDVTTTSGSSTSWSASANCAPGQRAIAGGGSASGTNLFIRASYPSADTWFVEWETEMNAAIGSRTLTVWVLCAPGT